MTNQDVINALPVAHKIIPPMLLELDCRKAHKGYIEFQDVIETVAMTIDKEINPALFEACKRVCECKRVITIKY
jgi:hypothetical protein